jgi:ribonuclease BN (tRNA processing enzyme)
MQIGKSGRVGRVIALALGRWVPVIAVVLAFEHPLLAVCGQTGVVLQVLGSGGPRGRDDRAQAGYLVWVDGKARVMVDAGAGTFIRLKESGADRQQIELLALSHFHPDHASEVPGLLWSGMRRQLSISGPSGNEGFPSLDAFLSALVGQTASAFPVLGPVVELQHVTVDVRKNEPTEVYSKDGLRVTGIGVPHRDVPSVGYRIDVGGVSVAFGGDQTGTNPAFTQLAKMVDVLVLHLTVSEDAAGLLAELHAKPSVVGRVAAEAAPGLLVLSHLGGEEATSPNYRSLSLSNLDGSLQHVRENYRGRFVVAKDLECVPVRKTAKR